MPVKNPIRAGDGDPRHGTPGGYTNHHCRCPACTNAIREYMVPRTRAWRHATGRHQPREQYLASVAAHHGTEAKYNNGCRCRDCREAARIARADRRRRAANSATRGAANAVT